MNIEEKVKNRMAELEKTRQELLVEYQSCEKEEDRDFLASEIVRYRITIMELQEVLK